MRALFVIVAALSVSGCMQGKSLAQINEERDRAKDEKACQDLGAATKDQLFQCRVTFEAQRRNSNAMYGAMQDAEGQRRIQATANKMMFGR